MKNIVWFLIPVLLIACGLSKSHDDGTNPPPPVAGCNRPNATPAKATLVLFGAPPCSACHVAFPEITALVEALPAEKKAALKVIMYVETGSGWTDGPSGSITNAYAASVHMCADQNLSDSTDSHHKPSFEAYTKYTGVTIDDMTLPAAVILDKTGVVVEHYTAGMTFSPVSIVDRAAQEASK
jgi:thiol-disulfide isomerase/thioredoxin